MAWPNELNVIGEMEIPPLDQLLHNSMDGSCQFTAIAEVRWVIGHGSSSTPTRPNPISLLTPCQGPE